MKMKTLLAGMLLSSAPTLAMADKMPGICASVANYAAQALDQRFEDGSWAGKYNPKSIVLKRNFKEYPLTFKYLGSCDDDDSKLPQSWCNVAGGSPTVYQVDVAKADDKSSYPFATVIVTYNRGGCWVDEASLK